MNSLFGTGSVLSLKRPFVFTVTYRIPELFEQHRQLTAELPSHASGLQSTTAWTFSRSWCGGMTAFEQVTDECHAENNVHLADRWLIVAHKTRSIQQTCSVPPGIPTSYAAYRCSCQGIAPSRSIQCRRSVWQGTLHLREDRDVDVGENDADSERIQHQFLVGRNTGNGAHFYSNHVLQQQQKKMGNA